MKIAGPIVVLILMLAGVLYLENEKPRADVVWVQFTDIFSLDPQ